MSVSIRRGKALTNRVHPDPLSLEQTSFVPAYRLMDRTGGDILALEDLHIFKSE